MVRSIDFANNYESIPEVHNEDNTGGRVEDGMDRRPVQTKNRRSVLVALVAMTGVLVLAMSKKNDSQSSYNMNVSLLGQSYYRGEECTPKWIEQPVDNFDPNNQETYMNRYYTGSKFFGGPGNPIFVIIGGEDGVDEVLYPFVNEKLAKDFNAYVLQTEHRFYGESQPLPKISQDEYNRDPELLKKYLTPDQAMADKIALIRHIQEELGCSTDRDSEDYCPIITVGASYPGFLSAMLRFVYPQVVDMSYASSAPLRLYAQDVSPGDYYEHLSDVAEAGSPGCAHAVKSTLMDAIEDLKTKPFNRETVESLGICWDSVPDYIVNIDIFTTEVIQIASTSNADFNMGYYPPSNPDSELMKQCRIFENTQEEPLERMRDFFLDVLESDRDCYEMTNSLADGPYARITGADWSGMGPGDNGLIWEFQCCTDLIIQTGFSKESMFPYRPFDMDWLTAHCQRRFQVSPTPTRLVDQWHFDDLIGHGASKILFTNGMLDGWFLSSYTTDLSNDVLALNFPNGTHHSDLRGKTYDSWPLDDDTDDIAKGYDQITEILGNWIAEV